MKNANTLGPLLPLQKDKNQSNKLITKGNKIINKKTNKQTKKHKQTNKQTKNIYYCQVRKKQMFTKINIAYRCQNGYVVFILQNKLYNSNNVYHTSIRE